ncbi:hydrogenase maturation protease [Actinomadura sp. HBU206391]|uniref:hydrogenase maturation protease n=1 Tax=Actinomadura sp. HBU206391 TaxID=2731692 RepID=UPI001650A02A|nr:hydrogenase maturation protease [Actinomadura sp. HBU206391]MBC6460327.1 hydrogenase maturation protease [Actinomadura sp. HBU206391]
MKVLVAGCGNIFLGDDGFGSVVARRLAAMPLPTGTSVTDFGTGGLHLAYELNSGYAAVILVDAVPRGGVPGTLYVIEPRPGDQPVPCVDGHGLTPEAVLALAELLGGDDGDGDEDSGGSRGEREGTAGRVLIVGCEPADTSPGMELSPQVAGAVEAAADLVLELIRQRHPERT